MKTLSQKTKNAIIDMRISGNSALEIANTLNVTFADIEKTIQEEVVSRLISGFKSLDIAFDLHLKPSFVIAIKKLMDTPVDASKIVFPHLEVV